MKSSNYQWVQSFVGCAGQGLWEDIKYFGVWQWWQWWWLYNFVNIIKITKLWTQWILWYMSYIKILNIFLNQYHLWSTYLIGMNVFYVKQTGSLNICHLLLYLPAVKGLTTCSVYFECHDTLTVFHSLVFWTGFLPASQTKL